MIRIILALLLLTGVAQAQQPTYQSGTVTPGHVPVWITNGVIGDGGVPPSSNVVTANPGQIIGNYGATSAAVAPVNWMEANPTCTSGLTAFQDCMSTTGGVTDDVRCMWNPGSGGTPGCIPWMVLNQTAGTISLSSSVLGYVTVQLACDGSTNDGATIQAAINSLSAKGGNILLWTKGTNYCNDTTAITNAGKPNVTLIAQGQGNVGHEAGSQYTQCPISLVWNGSAGGTMITFTAPVGSGATAQWLNGGGLNGLCLFGNGIVNYDIIVASQYHGLYENLYLDGALAGDLGLTDDATLTTDIPDDQFNTFSNIYINAAFQANSYGLVINYTVANASLNNFYGMDITFTTGGAGIQDNGGDNNHFYGTRIFRNAGTGAAVDLSENTTVPYTTNSETFYGLSTNAPIIARGTTSFPGKTPTYGNTIYDLDKGNGTPDPTIETGATITWFDSDGRSYFQNLISATIGANVNSTTYLGIANYNCAAVYPAVGTNLGVCANFSNGASEMDLWNGETAATDSFRFYQLTALNTGSLLLDLSTTTATLHTSLTALDAGIWGSGGINGSIIGGTTPEPGHFTTLSATGNTTTNITGGGTVCVQASNTGVLSAAASPCGSASMVFLATLTASNSAVLNDSVACGGGNCITSTYSSYMIVLENIIPATAGASLELQTSVNAGSSYASSGYISSGWQVNSAGGVVTSTNYILCGGTSPGLGNSSGYGLNGTIMVFNPSGGSHRTYVNVQSSYKNNTPVMETFTGAGYQDGANTAVNSLQWAMTSGNITSGVIKIYGIL